jgi:hypothetical protein
MTINIEKLDKEFFRQKAPRGVSGYRFMYSALLVTKGYQPKHAKQLGLNQNTFAMSRDRIKRMNEEEYKKLLNQLIYIDFNGEQI